MAGLLLPGIIQVACAASGGDADSWHLSQAELEQVEAGEVIVEAEVGRDPTRGDVRAAVKITAPPERIFRTMTDCAAALEFVPHLRECEVIESAEDGSWELVRHVVDYGWFMRRVSYVFRAEHEPFARIRFSNVHGDFREHRGAWELEPSPDGTGTIVTYRVHLVPDFYVPRWLMRSMLRRDLPALMKGLRAQCESGARAVLHSAAESAAPSSVALH